jgi:hypothetical protein
MKLQTASSVISLAKELENKAAGFYEDLAARYAGGKDSFLAFAAENKKYIVQIERAYYGVITDAIEGCFAFDLDADNYAVVMTLAGDAGQAEAVKQATMLEETMIRFYTDAAEQSQSLMADVPRAFMLIVKKRKDRLAKLEALG